MSNKELVRFEEVTPTLLRVAYFDGHLAGLIGHLKLPIYGAYDDLDEMVFAFLTLPSGKTVVLGEYNNSPRTGVDLYVDSKLAENISAAVYESCQQLGMPKEQVVWFRDKFQAEIDRLFAEQGDIQEIKHSSCSESESVIYSPIACFQHSLTIYTRAKYPEYWARLQYNLGLAYHKAFKNRDDLGRNLTWAINNYLQSQDVDTRVEFPERWEIGQETVGLIEHLSALDINRGQLSGARLFRADLRRENLGRAYSSKSIVMRFIYASGISDELQKKLPKKGAVFANRPPVDSLSLLHPRS
jgi:hypothetical protein